MPSLRTCRSRVLAGSILSGLVALAGIGLGAGQAGAQTLTTVATPPAGSSLHSPTGATGVGAAAPNTVPKGSQCTEVTDGVVCLYFYPTYVVGTYTITTGYLYNVHLGLSWQGSDTSRCYEGTQEASSITLAEMSPSTQAEFEWTIPGYERPGSSGMTMWFNVSSDGGETCGVNPYH